MKKVLTFLLAVLGLNTACSQNFDNFDVLKGGILAWKEAGMPVTADTYEVDMFKT